MNKKIAIEGLIPFTRCIWRNKECKAEWEPKLREASRIYNISEWKMVAEHKRKCGTIHVNKNNFEQMLDKLAEDGLFFKPIARTASYQGFSHRHIVPKSNEDYNVYGVLAYDKDDALEFAKLSNSRDKNMHIGIGELLGYPRCCSDAFTERWSGGIIDPIFEAAMKTKNVEYHHEDSVLLLKLDKVPIETNQMLRYFGLRTTSHLPCAFDCKETIKIAKNWKDVMKKTDEKAFDYLKELLEMPLRWDSYHGIVICTTPIFRGVTTTGYNERRIIKVGEVDW